MHLISPWPNLTGVTIYLSQSLVHTSLYLKSSWRWSSLICGFRTLKHSIEESPDYSPVLKQWHYFLTLHFREFSYKTDSYLEKKILPWNVLIILHVASTIIMAVWEYIRLRLIVGCLPFWGELFLAWYHMPDGGMCLLRKDKLLSFMFGKPKQPIFSTGTV